jgi:hypothetical protein
LLATIRAVEGVPSLPSLLEPPPLLALADEDSVVDTMRTGPIASLPLLPAEDEEEGELSPDEEEEEEEPPPLRLLEEEDDPLPDFPPPATSIIGPPSLSLPLPESTDPELLLSLRLFLEEEVLGAFPFFP